MLLSNKYCDPTVAVAFGQKGAMSVPLLVSLVRRGTVVEASISIKGHWQVHLVAINGRLVSLQNGTGSSVIRMKAPVKGVYFIKITSREGEVIRKVIMGG